MRNLLILFISTITFYSCSQNNTCEDHPDVNTSELKLSIESLEEEFLSIETKEELVDFMNRERTIAQYFLRGNEYPSDSIMINVLLQRLNNPHIDTLSQEVLSTFGDKSSLEEQFTKAFSFMQYYYPDFTPPKIKTIATGFDTDLYISDSLIVIGLDFYLGKKAKFRPINVPNYILEHYQKEYIVPSCILLYGISPRFNNPDLQDKTMLAEMIDYGKAFYFTKKMMPCTPDSLLIRYKAEEIKDSRTNEDLIWAHFLDNELLYSSDKFTKQKYLGDRPKTFDIGEKCPGRIGTWLGWQIVNQYVDRHTEITLPQLMGDNNAQEIFIKSKYRPGK
jgi:hypothetical protein